MADRIKGIVVEIGGDTGPLSAALKGVNGTIRETGSQLKDINRLLKLDPTNITLLGQKAGAAQKELLALQEKEKTLKQADSDLKKQLSEGKISTEQYQAYQRELIATQEKIKSLKKEASGIANTLTALGDKAKNSGERISNAGEKMLPATLAIAGVGGAAIKTASDFETSMSQTAGALDVPIDKMNNLRELAMKMGAETQFSATEAGNAMTELAKGGLTEADIEGGALKTTMDLAASSGMDLGSAANTVVQAMGAFGLSAKDSAQAVNALAGAAAASSTDVEPLSQGLSQCAAQAHMVGWSIQDTTAVLGAFADAGIVGSDAGTSLKTMLQRLGAPTDEAAAMIKDLGINVWDSNGHMKDAAGIAQELQTKLGNLTDAQKQAAMQTIFGSDATRAATILMNGGSQGLAKYTKATNDQTAAQRLANAQMGPTEKAMEQMKGSLETAGIAIGTALVPMIQKLAGFITDLANRFSSLSPSMQNTILTILGIVAAVAPLLIIIGKLKQGIGGILTAIGFLIANPIVALIIGVIAAIALLVVGIKHLWDTNEGFRNAVTGAWTAIQSAVGAVGAWFAGPFVDFFKNAWSGIQGAFSAVGGWFSSTFGAAWTGIKNIWSAVTGWFTGIWNGIKGVFKPNMISDAFGRAWGAIKDAWGGVAGWFRGVWNGISSGFRGAANAIIKAINWLIRGLNRIHFNIPDWVPGIGGKGFGIHIGEIPLLAKGGVIDKATLAMLGEQGKEAVLPLERNTGWIKDLARALMASMGGFSQPAAVPTAPAQKIVLESHINMDGRELALAASPYFIKQLGFDNG